MIRNGGFPRFVKDVKGSLFGTYTRARNGVNRNSVHILHKCLWRAIFRRLGSSKLHDAVRLSAFVIEAAA